MTENDDRLVTRDELVKYLNDAGFPLTRGTMSQLCAPSRSEGPAPEGYWGRRPVYSLKNGLAWAQQRLRRAPYRIHPATEAEGMTHHDP
jgi:hypothetical protein